MLLFSSLLANRFFFLGLRTRCPLYIITIIFIVSFSYNDYLVFPQNNDLLSLLFVLFTPERRLGRMPPHPGNRFYLCLKGKLLELRSPEGWTLPPLAVTCRQESPVYSLKIEFRTP